MQTHTDASNIEIAFGDVRLQCTITGYTHLPELLADRYGPFQWNPVEGGPGPLTVTIEFEEGSLDHQPGDDPGMLTVRYLDDTDFAVECGRRDFRVTLRQTGTTSYSIRGRLMDSVYTFDCALRVCLSEILPRHGGFLIHSCALLLDETHAAVLHGKSGSGKTTLSRKAGIEHTLTDELALIRKQEDSWFVYGTPFWGDFLKAGQPVRRILSGIAIFRPPQDRKLNARLEPGAMAFAVTANTLAFTRDTAPNAVMLQLAVSLCKAVTCIEFAFERGESWEDIRRRLQQSLQ